MTKQFPTRGDGVIRSLEGIEVGDQVFIRYHRYSEERPVLICIRLTPQRAIFRRADRPEEVWGFHKRTALQVGYSKHTKFDVMAKLFNLK